MTKQLQFTWTRFIMLVNSVWLEEFSAGTHSDAALEGLPCLHSLEPQLDHQRFSICIVAKQLFPKVLWCHLAVT